MSRESYIERAVCKKARERGWRNRKNDTHAGDPDRSFYKGGTTVLIEFKQPGKEPTALQHDTIQEWRDDGFAATWVDSWQDALIFLDDHDPELES